MTHSTYQKLVVAAAGQFRQKGYSATAIADILDIADIPKGSLYHHFPGGKPDLALAAAKWSSNQVLEFIDLAFEKNRQNKGSFIDGAEEICLQIANVFETQDRWDFSPVTTIFMDGNNNERFQTTATGIFREWESAFLNHSANFDISLEEAKRVGNKLLMLLEGAWILSRAVGNASPLRQAAKYIKES